MDNSFGAASTGSTPDMKKVLTIVGTRPEVIKMAPVVAALQELSNEAKIENHFGFTGQHEIHVVQPILELFKLKFDFEISLVRSDSYLSTLTGLLVTKIAEQLKLFNPDIVLVHGDTTTAFCSSLAAFYEQIPVAHVEAGLRTSRFESPFPEEMNRRLISRLATLHFAPTTQASFNLCREGVSNTKIWITGNTVVDAVNHTLNTTLPGGYNVFPMIPLREVILITCHRRESWGEPMLKLCNTVKQLAQEHEDYIFVWPVHPNPAIKSLVTNELGGVQNVRLYGPLNYSDFVWLLKACQLAVTDSGGVLEEAAVLGVPTLVMRSETERPEALELPGVELVGYDFDTLGKKIVSFIDKPPEFKPSLSFGDGNAGKLIADILLRYL